MRVAHVINSLGQGGAERSLTELLPYLSGKGVESTVVCLERRPDGFHDEVVGLGYDVHVLERRGGLIANAAAIRRLLKRITPDLVHTTIFDADVAGRLACVATGIPVVGSIVNTSYDPVRLTDPRVRRWKLEAARMLDGWTARHLGDHFHALTETVKRAAVRDLHLAPDRISVIPRGRDPQRLGRAGQARRARVRDQLEIPADATVIINVGRREHQKGQRFLIQAVDRLRQDRHHRVLLLIAGRDGSESAGLDELVRATHLDEAVRFLGHRDDVPDLLAAADVFAFPSLFEGFGGSLIEAMALELPIVASDLDAVQEVVAGQDAAIMVPPADSKAVADAIAQVIEQPELAQRLGSSGRRLFESRYTLDSVAAAMVSMYETVTAAHGR